MKIKKWIETLFLESEGKTNKNDNTTYRVFCPSDRCIIDFADNRKFDGWEQYNTNQDASYFGVWINLLKRQTLTYCEGDWSLVFCEDDEHYNREICSMNEFYDKEQIVGEYSITIQ